MEAVRVCRGGYRLRDRAAPLISRLGLHGFPFLTFFPAVILTALFAGPGPAFFCIIASAVAGTVWLPGGLGAGAVVSERLVDYARFIAVSLPIVWLGDQVRRSQRRANEEAVTRARLAAIVRSSDDAILSKNLGGIIESWNDAAARLFGYTADEAVGRPTSMLIPAERAEEEEAMLTRLRAGERIEHFETVRVRKDGTRIDVSVTMSPVRDGRGVIVGASKITRDIGDTKRLAEERERLLESERAARAEAERAGRLKDEFLATLSHELRTPLNAILGYAQLLRGLTHDPDEMAEGLEVIERNARIQTQIIADLLDMSRIIVGKLLLEMKDVSMATVVRSAVETLRPAAAAKRIRVQPPPETAGGMICGDAGRLQQVVWNLLTNAIKFTPIGGRVGIGLSEHDSLVELSVTDTGQGIAPEFVPFVFDRFRQADATTTRRHGGLGLGLSIVKHLVELHGGTVEVRSDGQGRGATFVVRLPAAPARADRCPQSNGAESPVGTSAQAAASELSGLRVLVVDDERDAHELIRRVLEGHGARVNLAESVAEAVVQLAAAPHDVLLSDIGMPERDGYELIRLVRTRRADEGGGIPAAAITAFARPEDRFLAMQAGYQSHVAKPVDAKALVATVAYLAGAGDTTGQTNPRPRLAPTTGYAAGFPAADVLRSGYHPPMPNPTPGPPDLDPPEPRWPAMIAVLAVAGLDAALPSTLAVGPRWLSLVIIPGLAAAGMITHRGGQHHLNQVIGHLLAAVMTLLMVWSLVLLVRALPERKESPLLLMRSAAALWVTNVLVFSLWYWRLDAGGPYHRDKRVGHPTGSFLFPQMVLEDGGRKHHGGREWSPNYLDYLFLAFNTSTAFSPTDTPVLSRWAKVLTMIQATISLAVVAVLAARAVNIL